MLCLVLSIGFQLYKLKPESAMGGTCLEFNGTKIELMEKGIVIIAGTYKTFLRIFAFYNLINIFCSFYIVGTCTV